MKKGKKPNTHLPSPPSQSDENDTSPTHTETSPPKYSEDINEPSLSDDERYFQQVIAALQHLSSETTSLKSLIENRLEYDRTKELAFERLYVELDEYKKNSAFERNRPLFTDLILYFDRIEIIRMDIDSASKKTSHFASLLKTLSDEILEILQRQGIERIEHSPSFHPAIQRAISTEPTNNKEEDNHIAQIVRQGFRYREQIVRAEEVVVKKYIP